MLYWSYLLLALPPACHRISLDPRDQTAVKSIQFVESDSPQSNDRQEAGILVLTIRSRDHNEEHQPMWTMHAIEAERLRGLEIAKHPRPARSDWTTISNLILMPWEDTLLGLVLLG